MFRSSAFLRPLLRPPFFIIQLSFFFTYRVFIVSRLVRADFCVWNTRTRNHVDSSAFAYLSRHHRHFTLCLGITCLLYKNTVDEMWRLFVTCCLFFTHHFFQFNVWFSWFFSFVAFPFPTKHWIGCQINRITLSYLSKHGNACGFVYGALDIRRLLALVRRLSFTWINDEYRHPCNWPPSRIAFTDNHSRWLDRFSPT